MLGMPDLAMLQGAAITSLIVSLIAIAIGLALLWVIIFTAARAALRSHSRWMYEGGPEEALRRESQRATR